MTDIIQLLPDHVANQIAAGEVVQRPSSVVKELLENAIDARATKIKLIVKNAGKTLIQVIDNGKGMSVTDARLCFERHATSKIRSAEDLFQLNTKGFRGEALASIAAIAHVDLNTRQEHDELGTGIVIEGSKVKSQEATATPQGTSVAVKNLFYNVPARRNFLKSDNVEMRHIIDEFQRVSLAHPNLSFSLYHNGSDLFNLPEQNFRQRIVSIFGAKTNEKLIPIKESTDIIKISGFVLRPPIPRKTKKGQFFFVNNRFVRNAYLNHAISSAFKGLIKEGSYPSYFLNLKVNPATIDINIHPTKTEIKFDDEPTLYAILRSAVKHSLGQYSVIPVLDFDRDPDLDIPYKYKDKDATAPTIEIDANYNPFKENNTSKSSISKSNFKEEVTPNWESLYIGLESKGTKTEQNFSQIEFESDPKSPPIFDSENIEIKPKTFQIHNKYLINTIKSGVLVIDQNRAHQRILYEKFLKQMTSETIMSQRLIFPLQLQYSKIQVDIINQLRQDLEKAGYQFSKIENESIEFSGIPADLSESEVSKVLEQIINDAEQEVIDTDFGPTDRLAKCMSKSLAIKTGQSLSPKEQEHMVNSLFACKESLTTPNHKIIYVTMSLQELDQKFNL